MPITDPFEITQRDGDTSSSPSSAPGSLSQPPASWAQLLASRANLMSAIGVIAWSARDLISLAERDARPLLGAGIILIAAALRFGPADVINAIKAWRSK